MFIFLAAAFLLLGSFSNSFRATRPAWRFQLFFLDFTLGFAALALLAAFTLGSQTELTFGDRLLVAGRLKEAQVIAAAVLANLALLLLFAASSAVTLARVLPLAFGPALVIRAGAQLLYTQSEAAALLAFGIILCMMGTATSWPANVATGKQGPSYKFALLAVLGGLCLGVAMLLTSNNIAGQLGMGPYAAIAIFGATGLVATPILSIYFMNLPVEGARVSFVDYRLGTGKQHGFGVAGGIACAAGLLCAFFTADLEEANSWSRGMPFVFTHFAAVLAIISGLLWWKEAADLTRRTKQMLFASISALSIAIFLFAWADLIERV